jgi:hypothetical protein
MFGSSHFVFTKVVPSSISPIRFHGVVAAIVAVATLAPASVANDRVVAAPSGVSASMWTDLRAAYEASRHALVAVDGRVEARNPGQRWTTAFDGRGSTTTPNAGGWSWGLELANYGWGDTRSALDTPASMIRDAHRLAYVWDDVVTEWYVNDARGLEHGFTIRARPQHAVGPLTLSVSVRGDLAADVTADGRDVDFVREGARVVTYTGLVAFDAAGSTLPARFDVEHGGGLRLTIEDADAIYPLTIDPVAQQAYLKASNTNALDQFGESIAISGNTVVVGAPNEDSAATGVNGTQTDNSANGAGAAYVFVRNNGTWTQQAYLKASNTGTDDVFGWSVAISGDTIVVGALHEDSNATGINGNQANNSATDSGAAYVFVRSGTTWTQQAYLKPSTTDIGDSFGRAVTIDGNTIVVGAEGEDSNATGVNGNQANNGISNSGAAYVFVRSGTTWSQQAYLKASNPGISDLFGRHIALSGDTIVVGAFAEDSNATGINGNQADNSAIEAGAAYVFVRSGTTWSQQAYLKASNTGAADLFGDSVTVSGNTIVVGAPGEDSGATGTNGNQSDNGTFNAGAAYVFVRSGTTWTQQAYLKASNTGSNDEFGYCVSLAGNTLAVGAIGEASNATGINGNQANNSAMTAGAAYVFGRSGTTWSQQSYLKASNTGSDDWFGQSLAISGQTVAVGALFENSAATGVNGNQADESATDAGAAYVFDLVGCASSATATAYGVGKPGTFGVPVLSSTNPPILNTTADLTLTGGLPGAGPVVLFAGFAPAALAFDGGTLLANPTFIVNLPPLDGGGGFVLPVPVGPTTCGLHLYFQVMFVDPGASGFYQTAQTNGLDWTLGG